MQCSTSAQAGVHSQCLPRARSTRRTLFRGRHGGQLRSPYHGAILTADGVAEVVYMDYSCALDLFRIFVWFRTLKNFEYSILTTFRTHLLNIRRDSRRHSKNAIFWMFELECNRKSRLLNIDIQSQMKVIRVWISIVWIPSSSRSVRIGHLSQL